MRTLIATALMVVIPVSFALCQVDTLMLVEINNIEIVDNITELYVEDLDGDEIKEIILCTQYYIYIFDSQTNEPLWTSPLLTNPNDLLFKDINHDGLLDISVHDSLNIYLFDPHNYSTIWISPALDSTYKCYTIGDRNNNNLPDIVTAQHWHSDSTLDLDTVYIKTYDSPLFELADESFFYVPWYDSVYGLATWGKHETPSKIIIEKLTSQNQLNPYIFIFTAYGSYYFEPTVGGNLNSGRLHLLDAETLDLLYVTGGGLYSSGYPLYIDYDNDDDSTYLYTLSNKNSNGVNMCYIRKDFNTYSSDTAFCENIWGYSWVGYPPDPISGVDWRGFDIDDFIS